MKITKETTMAEFITFTSMFTVKEEKIKELTNKLQRHKSLAIKGKLLPENLNHLTWAQLTRIQSCKTTTDLLVESSDMLLGLKIEELLKCSAFDVIAFMLFIERELKKIIKLFDKIKYNPTSDEKRAGIEKINFGLFGTLDWWAKRMGITNHEEAEKTPWMRIYICMKNDNLTGQYQQRLMNIITKKKR